MRTKNYASFYDDVYRIIKSNDHSESSYIIASYLLKNLYDSSQMGIYQIAKECNVSVATVSRFAKKIGYEDFNAFKIAMEEQIKNRDYCLANHPMSDMPFKQYNQESINNEINIMCDSIKQSFSSKMLEKIDILVDDIYRYEDVYILDNASGAPLTSHLFNELLVLGKYVSEIKDMNAITTKREKNCVIIVSMYGVVYDLLSDNEKQMLSSKSSKIWLISQKEYEKLQNYIYLKRTSSCSANYMAWMLLAEQIIFSYKKKYCK